MYNHKNHSKIFKRWFIALEITIFILGIVAGFVFKDGLIEELSYYTSRYSEKSFNWTIAVVVWLSDIIPAAFLYAVYAHLENQEIQINILNAMRNPTETNSSSAPSEKKAETSQMKKIDAENNYWKCPNCGAYNPVGTESCRVCKKRNI